MEAALAAEGALAADETPVNVLDKAPPPAPASGDAGEADPEDGKKAASGAPHVLIVTTPDARLRLMFAPAARPQVQDRTALIRSRTTSRSFAERWFARRLSTVW